MKQAMEIIQPPDSFALSPLLTATPVLMQANEAEPIIMATLSAAGQEFAFAYGRAALMQKLCADCIAPADQARTSRFDWHFSDPAREPSDLTTSATRPKLPDVIGRAGQDVERVFFLYVRETLAWFDGHFPNDPILPAVVQIDWAIHFGINCNLDDGLDRNHFAGLNRLKFRAVITPDTVLRLTLGMADNRLQFTYESRDGLHSKGKILFHGGSNQR